MGNFNKKLLGLAAAGMLVSGSAFAEPSLQNVMDGIAVDGSLDINATTDYLSDDSDTYWSVSGRGQGGATMVVELAGNAGSNVFGIYNRYTGTKVDLFGGAAANGDIVNISISAAGTLTVNSQDWAWVDDDANPITPDVWQQVGGGFTSTAGFGANNFGFFLRTPAETFYSDSTKNSDTSDHLHAFAGNDEAVQIEGFSAGNFLKEDYLLAWEDLAAPGWDADYQDMVLMIESITPVPAPATLALLGLGLLGIGYRARRQKA